LLLDIRNQIYDYCVDDWLTTHGPQQRVRFGIDPLAPFQTNRAVFANTLDRLVMTPSAGASSVLVSAAQRALDANSYLAMKRDLTLPPIAHASRQMMDEYRSIQRGRLDPFIHWEELDAFMGIFYPSKDPAVRAAYRGRPLTITFPWDNKTRFDILPMLELFNSAPHVQCRETWAQDYMLLPNAILHEDRIYNSIFAPANSLRAYLQSPNALPIEKVLFRSHQHWYWPSRSHNYATLEIWFRPTPAGDDNLDWVDGKNWAWPTSDPLPPNGRWRETTERRKRRRIWQFLIAAGLNHPEIAASWYIRFGIDGVHSRGGLGWS
jgi:hypothetical protein